MYRLLISVLFIVFCVTTSIAQSTREKARALFLDGKYAEAKPLFQKLLKGAPRDGSYNYWYAVCCYETNDTVADIEKMLKYAVTRKVNNAHRYLGDMYKRYYRYDEAIASYEEFIDACDDEELVALYEDRCEHVKRLHRMIKMTERVCVIDSFVVDKSSFLFVYRTGRDIGKLAMAGEFFGKTDAQGTVAVTERGTDLYFSRSVATDEGEVLKLFNASNVNNQWSEAKQLEGIETGGNDCYPFMAVDGSTFYFASDGEGSIGGYDIFVTRYDSEDGVFLKPENVGMPFNSEANDYMLVVNDIVNLGWFATDRRMEDGKVCVYVFVPNVTKATYNYESEDSSRIVALSQLSSIVETQTDEDVVRKARQKLLMLMYEQKDVVKNSGFIFIIDDLTEYTDIKQFKCAEARKMYDEWKKRSDKYCADVALLEKRRDEYATANAGRKQSMKAALIELENRLIDEADALDELLVRIRNTEKTFISK